MTTKKQFSTPGFVLLYSVLVSSIVITVGLLLANILLKQLVIASTARDAKIAYYAADAGRDCALYWVNQLGPLLFNGGIMIQCNGGVSDPNPINLSSPVDKRDSFTYEVSLPAEGNIPERCAVVEVFNGVPLEYPNGDIREDNERVIATIQAYGYNDECDSTSPRLIQRFIETTVIQ